MHAAEETEEEGDRAEVPNYLPTAVTGTIRHVPRWRRQPSLSFSRAHTGCLSTAPGQRVLCPPLTKEDLDKSLESIESKIASKFQTELHTSTNTQTQEIAALGTRTNRLETKHDKVSIAHNDLPREFESLTAMVTQLQS